MSKIVAITGASGIIGQKLSVQLELNDSIEKIIQISIHERHRAHPKVEFIKADIRHPLIADVLRSHKVDTLIHLAFQPEPFRRPSKAHEVDVIGSLKILNACSAARVQKIIMPSVTAVYGAHADNANYISEKSVPRPNRGFQLLKDRLEVENLCMQYAQKHPTAVVAILRLATTVGAQVRNFFTRFLSAPIIPTIMGFDPMMQFVHEDDVVQAFEQVVARRVSGIFNIVGEGALPLSKIIRLMGKFNLSLPSFLVMPLLAMLWKLRLTDLPTALIDYLRFVWTADGEKAKRELGFVPKYSSEKAILDCIENYRIREFTDEPADSLLVPDIITQENLESFIDSRIKKIIDQGPMDEKSTNLMVEE